MSSLQKISACLVLLLLTTLHFNVTAQKNPKPEAGDVTLTDNGPTVILNNGIVELTIVKSTGEIRQMVYNGQNILQGGYSGGRFYWSWNMPNYQNPVNCTYTLTTDPQTNHHTLAEIKLHMNWSKSPRDAAQDVEIWYALKKGVSGLYAAAKLIHPAAYPFNPGGEWRMSSYPGATFNWMTVDSLRNFIIPNQAENLSALPVPGAPKEVVRITSGPWINHYECKYDYSADFGDLDTWGWSSTSQNIGLWMTAPSKEYYPGGPMKRELMCHADPVLLNMLGGTHYGGGGDGAIAQGEEWQKIYGPFLIYCNKVAPGTKNAPMALWEDAKKRARAEQALWPYDWFSEPDYVKSSGRGTVTGKLQINDPAPYAKPYRMWVGLAIPPKSVRGSKDFQFWSKNYQFWVRTDAQGNFTLPNVLPGVYDLYAFGTGVIGQLTKQAFVKVSAGGKTSLGNVEWTPERVAPTVWEIGIPDRNATEFRHGKDWWVGGTYPDLNWARFMDYPKEFPNGVNFTIGKSDWSKDWNWVQPYNVVGKEATQPPVWKINFTLTTAPTSGTNASLYLAAAGSTRASLMVRVNGINVLPKSDTTRIQFPNPSGATIRKGIHGLFGDIRLTFPSDVLHAGENVVELTLTRPGGDVIYDYLRLEAVGTRVDDGK